MLVKLLKDVTQNGQIKTTVRPSRKLVIGWFEGTVLDMPPSQAAKFIQAGQAEEYEEVTT